MAAGRMYRIEEGRILLGVCGGVAEYFAMDPKVVRVIWAALALDCRFAVAPPLLVAFTEFSSPTAAARKRPFRAGAAIFLCALAGTASRLLLQAVNRTDHALSGAALAFPILRSLGMYVPPAGALAILPMLLPAERLPRYPLQIALGTALFLALALVLFRAPRESHAER